jgi:hypothetical protein
LYCSCESRRLTATFRIVLVLQSLAIIAFLTTFKPSEQLALNRSFTHDSPANPVQAATDTINLLLGTQLQKKESALRASLNDSNLTTEQMMATLT